MPKTTVKAKAKTSASSSASAKSPKMNKSVKSESKAPAKAMAAPKSLKVSPKATPKLAPVSKSKPVPKAKEKNALKIVPAASPKAPEKGTAKGTEKPAPSPVPTGVTLLSKKSAAIPAKGDAKAPSAKVEGAEPVKKASTKAVRKEKIDASQANWDEYKVKYASLKPVPYTMSGQFAEGSALQHKVLGWGYIMSVQNDRLEVLFKDGLKILISNYRA